MVAALKQVGESRRPSLAPLFKNHQHLTVAVQAMLYSADGNVFVPENAPPEAALLSYPPFAFVGGDSKSAAGKSIISSLNSGTCVLYPDDSWRIEILRHFEDRATPAVRTPFFSHQIDVTQLQSLETGISKEFEIQRITIEIANRLSAEVDKHCIFESSFPTVEDFVKHGLGFVAINRNRIACAATSATIFKKQVEIEVVTAEEFRRRGLATAVGARLVRHCLEKSLEPHWDAANSTSEKLAKRLGYVAGQSYEVYLIS